MSNRFAAILAGFLALACAAREPASPGRSGEAADLGAFREVARVLRHPRCMNCHPSGDRPRVGEQGELHPQNVQRGPDDHGSPGLHCATCHRAENQDLARVPGAPHWSLAPASMGWEGLDDHELAEALKDRARNGDRSLGDLLEHVRDDPLVRWGWEPGVGRAPVPVEHGEFVAAFRRWIDAGAGSPPRGTTSTF